MADLFQDSGHEEKKRRIGSVSDFNRRRRAGQHGWLSAVIFTAVLLGLIALSIRTVAGDLAFVLLAAVAVVGNDLYKVIRFSYPEVVQELVSGFGGTAPLAWPKLTIMPSGRKQFNDASNVSLPTPS